MRFAATRPSRKLLKTPRIPIDFHAHAQRARCCRSKYQHTTHPHDLPHSVTITRAHHAFEGESLTVVGQAHRHNCLHLLLVLPDGSRSLIPASWTDFPGSDQPISADHSRHVALASLSDLLHARSIIDALLRRLPTFCEEPAQLTGKERERATESGYSGRSTARHSGVGKPEQRTASSPDRIPRETDRKSSGYKTRRS